MDTLIEDIINRDTKTILDAFPYDIRNIITVFLKPPPLVVDSIPQTNICHLCLKHISAKDHVFGVNVFVNPANYQNHACDHPKIACVDCVRDDDQILYRCCAWHIYECVLCSADTDNYDIIVQITGNIYEIDYDY